MENWDNAVVVDSRELQRLRDEHAKLQKASRKQRLLLLVLAVGPKLIPYGSWVWVEGHGWYRAQDCGAAIKGFRLDLLTATQRDAMAFGKQDRFVIVVPSAA